MSEADFFSASAGAYRGSKYPGFTGGTTDSSGNSQPVGSSTNISAATGNNQSPDQVRQQAVDKGNSSAQTGGTLGTDPTQGGNAVNSIPASSDISKQTPSPTLGGLAAQTVLPAAGNIVGTAAGNAASTGAGLSDALGAGGEALSTRVGDAFSGNLSGLLSSSSGSSGSGAASSYLSSTPAEQVGQDVAEEGAGSGLGSIAGAGLSGVGTFLGGLISGEDPGQAAISGVGAAGGAYLGSLIFPGVGTIIGSFLGSQLGGLFAPRPSVGPDGGTDFDVDANGNLSVGASGADNGADPSVTQNAANSTATSINKILNDNNLRVDPTKLTRTTAGLRKYDNFALEQGSNNAVGGNALRSALDVWNYLLKNNAVVSKTPDNELPATSAQTSSAGNAPVLNSPGSVVQQGATVPAVGTPTNPTPLSGFLPPKQ